MAAEWYYADQGQQRGPITFEELQQRAASGQLRPTDLVWNPSLPNWVPASTQTGLFDDVLALAPPLRIPENDRRSRPQPRPGTPYDDWRENDRPRPPSSSGAGWRIALFSCGGVVLLAMLCCGVIGLIAVFNGGQSNERSWNLQSGGHTHWAIPFKKGDQVVIDVTSTKDSDMDLFIFLDKAKMDSFLTRNNIDIAAKDRNLCFAFDNGDSKDCRVLFNAPATQDYWVLLVNRLSQPQPFRNVRNNGKLVFQPAPK